MYFVIENQLEAEGYHFDGDLVRYKSPSTKAFKSFQEAEEYLLDHKLEGATLLDLSFEGSSW